MGGGGGRPEERVDFCQGGGLGRRPGCAFALLPLLLAGHPLATRLLILRLVLVLRRGVMLILRLCTDTHISESGRAITTRSRGAAEAAPRSSGKSFGCTWLSLARLLPRLLFLRAGITLVRVPAKHQRARDRVISKLSTSER